MVAPSFITYSIRLACAISEIVSARADEVDLFGQLVDDGGDGGVDGQNGFVKGIEKPLRLFLELLLKTINPRVESCSLLLRAFHNDLLNF